MHVITVAMKRGHWSSVNRTRRMFKAFDLTASRFDMMYALNDEGGETTQASLRRALGVCAPVASRMTRDLEKQGQVTRRPSEHDRRDVIITMTAYGRECLHAAIRLLRGNRVADRLVARWLKQGLPPLESFKIDPNVPVGEPPRPRMRDIEAYHEIARLEDSLRCVRDACGDGATLVYPWQPAE